MTKEPKHSPRPRRPIVKTGLKAGRDDTDIDFSVSVPAIPVLDFLHASSSDDFFNPPGAGD
jgi:hypothetical protein